MYIFYSGENKEYAYVGVKTNEKKGPQTKGKYLGRVLDADRHIYRNKERGIFTYDVETDTYGPAPEGFVEPIAEKKEKMPAKALSFGDVWLYNGFLYHEGLDKLLEPIMGKNRDRFFSVLLYYLCNKEPNVDIEQWYYNSITNILYPNARFYKGALPRFFEDLGDPKVKEQFFTIWQGFIESIVPNPNIVIIDPLALADPKVVVESQAFLDKLFNREKSILIATQRESGIPLYYLVQDDDLSRKEGYLSLQEIFDYFDLKEERIASFVLKQPSYTLDNHDYLFARSMGFTTNYLFRVDLDPADFSNQLQESAGYMLDLDNWVEYEDQDYLVAKKEVQVNPHKSDPDQLYAVIELKGYEEDIHRYLLEKAQGAKTTLSLDQVLALFRHARAYGILSSRNQKNHRALINYLQRPADQIIGEFSAFHQKYMGGKSINEQAREGEILMGLLAAGIKGLIANDTSLPLKRIIGWISLAGHEGSIVHPSRISFDNPSTLTKEIFTYFGFKIPESLSFQSGQLQYKSKIPKPIKRQSKERSNRKGRPKGALNKKTLIKLQEEERLKEKLRRRLDKGESIEEILGPDPQPVPIQVPAEPPVKKKRGRPPGAKNLTPQEREERKRLKEEAKEKARQERKERKELEKNQPVLNTPEGKRPRGRPKGAKNKKTLLKEQAERKLLKRLYEEILQEDREKEKNQI